MSAAKAPTLRLLEWRHLSTSVVAPPGDDRGGKAAGAQVPRRRKVRAPEAKRSSAADNSWDDSFMQWSWGESADRARTEEAPGAKRARRLAVPGAKCARHRRQPSRSAGTKLEGVDPNNHTKIAARLRFHTSESGDEQISLEEYIGRMKENQNDILYITGQSIATVSASPSLITLRKRGVEVLYVVDPVNLFCVQHLKEFGGKKLKSTTREELNESGGKKLKSTTKKDWLHMFDPVDESCVQQLKEFGIKKLKSTHIEDTLHLVDPIVDENCAQQVKEFGAQNLKPSTKAGLDHETEDEKKQLETPKTESDQLSGDNDGDASLSDTLPFPGQDTAPKRVSCAPLPPRPSLRTASGPPSCGPLAGQARSTSARAARPPLPPHAFPGARTPSSRGTATRG